MNVAAMFKVESIMLSEFGRVVKLRAVYSNDPGSPNYSWSKATPAGELTMTITNPDAYAQFEVGKVCRLEFSVPQPASV